MQGSRALGIELPPGPRGDPVFDRAGRLAGVAVTQAGVDTLVSVAALPGGVAPPAAGAMAAREVSLNAIYETALRLRLQVLVSRT